MIFRNIKNKSSILIRNNKIYKISIDFDYDWNYNEINPVNKIYKITKWILILSPLEELRII